MCWNVQVSFASAIVGWITCVYLKLRQRSPRDDFYARYLLTFTFTQLVDMYLWSLHDNSPGSITACKSYQMQFGRAPAVEGLAGNFFVSKYVIPAVVFSQHCMQLSYPSNAYKSQRYEIMGLHLVPCLIMSFCFACSTLTTAKFPSEHATMFWGGDFGDWPFMVIQMGATFHSGIVAYGFKLIGMRGRVLWAHLLPLAAVVTTLWVTEHRMDFGSKWCTYCLVYSAVYIAEPFWLPDSDAQDGKVEADAFWIPQTKQKVM